MHTIDNTVGTEPTHPAHRRVPHRHVLAWWALAAALFLLLSLVGI